MTTRFPSSTFGWFSSNLVALTRRMEARDTEARRIQAVEKKRFGARVQEIERARRARKEEERRRFAARVAVVERIRRAGRVEAVEELRRRVGALEGEEGGRGDKGGIWGSGGVFFCMAFLHETAQL